MPLETENILRFLSQPKTMVFCIAAFNYFWFLYHSRVVQDFGSTVIAFCVYCDWYWEWSLTNLPSLSIFAASFMLFARWQAYLAACAISSYQIFKGLNWLFDNSGYLSSFERRIEIIYEKNFTSFSDINSFWTLLDVQYLLAVLIFVTASIYLTKSLPDKNKTSKNILA